MQDRVFTPEALEFLEGLLRRFGPRRDQLLAARRATQARIHSGMMPDFLPETAEVRAGQWSVAPSAPDLTDRRVEITGPVERKMMINALNSGAKVFMADFEDALSPTWDNVVAGQAELHGRRPPDARVREPRGEALSCSVTSSPRWWCGPARLASGGEAPAGGRRADVREPVRLRALLLPQRAGAARARQRTVLLPAEAGEPPRSPPVERRLQRTPRTRSASRAERSAPPC